jgi:DNA repair exonuclease SbcCD nuclease subunit
MTTFNKIACFTDIHFGRRSSDKVHNQDCIDYLEWFAKHVKADKAISHVAFLGDWFESRNSINVETLEYSYRGMQILGQLNIPVFFTVGNHDLARRSTRDVFSTRIFNEIPNVHVIDKITVIDDVVFAPFLFDDEYVQLEQHMPKRALFGHLEFKGFAITAYNTIMDHGPDHRLLSGYKRIFSGHFHKRQQLDNVCYIGNTFPMDMGDADDKARGFATYDFGQDKVTFTDWTEAPSYTKVNLSSVLDESWKPGNKQRVKVTVDVELSFTEIQDIREALLQTYELRDIQLDDKLMETANDIIQGDDETTKDLKFNSIDELVIGHLKDALDTTSKYEPEILIKMYQELDISTTARDSLS